MVSRGIWNYTSSEKKALTAKDEGLLRSNKLLGALVISHQSF